MRIGKAWRLGGFVTALAASGALIASATGATGAYFTDSHGGALNASSGHLKISVSNPHLSFASLVPGTDQTLPISYSTDSSTNEDVWMVFDTSSQEYADLTGDNTQSAPTTANPLNKGGLGRYGHFKVAVNGTTDFESYNLANLAPGSTDPVCGVNANGDGGSSTGVTEANPYPPLCGVPGAILLAQNLASGSSGEIEVTFGITGLWTAQNTPVVDVPFTIVATQHGVRPDA